MEKAETSLFDTLTIPIPLASRPEPESVTIQDPPNPSTVGINFTASGVVDGTETSSVQKCWVQNSKNSKNADSITNNGDYSWSAPFTNVTPSDQPPSDPGGPYTLSALGNDGSKGICDQITVSSTPPAHSRISFGLSTKYHAKKLFHSISFKGPRPSQKDGKPVPLSLSSTLPGAFIIGGPLPPASLRVVKCTLDHRLVGMLTLQPPRWFASFSKVPVGNYTLFLETPDGKKVPVVQIEIGALKRC